jgi:hypothetical protein
VITGADVLLPDGDGFRLASGLMVQGQGGLIGAIGTAAECPEVPADALRIDGTGATLMQGLMDAWCHVTDPSDLDSALGAGVTTLRVMDSPSWLARVLSQRAMNGVVTPRCVYFGPDLRRHVPRMGGDAALEERKVRASIEADIRRQVNQGVDGFTLGHDAPQRLVRLAVQGTRRFGLPLSIRSPGKIPFKDAWPLGDAIGSLEMLLGDWHVPNGADGRLRPLPARVVLEKRAARVAKEQRPVLTGLVEFVRQTQLLGLEAELSVSDLVQNRYAGRSAEELIVSQDELESLAPLTRSRWSQAAHQMRRSLPASLLRYMRAAMPPLATVLQKLVHDDAHIVVGTGAGTPFVPMGTAVFNELKLLVEFGMEPAQSIAAASTRSAAFMGLQEVGCLKSGSRADLLLVEGDPLGDLRALRRMRAVAVGGRWTTAEDLAKRREEQRLVLDQEVEFVTAAVVDSIGGTAEELNERLGRYAKESGVRVRRETVESLRDAYLTSDVPRREHAAVLTRFIARYLSVR